MANKTIKLELTHKEYTALSAIVSQVCQGNITVGMMRASVEIDVRLSGSVGSINAALNGDR